MNEGLVSVYTDGPKGASAYTALALGLLGESNQLQLNIYIPSHSLKSLATMYYGTKSDSLKSLATMYYGTKSRFPQVPSNCVLWYQVKIPSSP